MAAFSTLALLGLTAAGTAISAIQQKKASNAQATASEQAGQAQRASAESQAELADFNAAVADLQARDAIERGVDEENRFRSSVKVMVGSQRAGFAASNVDVSYGSAADVQADAAYLGELDALTIRTNAAREAWGYQVQAEDLRKRATIARKEGVYAEQAGKTTAAAQRTSGTLGVIGTIANTGASLLMARYGFGGRR